MHGNMHTHPDLPGMLNDLERAARAYERNQKVAAGMIATGTALVAAGTIFAKLERFRMKVAR